MVKNNFTSEKIMEVMKLLGEQFVKMMQFNNHLLEENLKLMKRVSELEDKYGKNNK